MMSDVTQSPTPSRPTPASLAPPASPTPAPAPDAVITASASEAFGRVEPDGTVWVRTVVSEGHEAGEVRVGQYAAGTPEEGLAFYARKYDDLAAEANLTLTRLTDGRASNEAAAALATRLREQATTPSMVGDLAALTRIADDIDAAIEAQRVRRAEQKAAARAATLAARERIVAEAESLASSVQWKPTGERFRQLLDEWKALPHGDRSAEQALWKRFSTARSAFDKARRTHFAALEAQRSSAATAKEALIAEAEALSSSQDWGPTTAAYRSLVDRWKAAPRGSHRDEQAWWNRFRAAQDVFFAARQAATDERESVLRDNLAVKEALLAEAQALLPITDPAAASRALKSIGQKWEAAGAVPRSDRDRIEGGLRAVEDALRAAESERWRRTDPAKRAFAESTVEKFRTSLAKVESQAEAARAKGDAAALARAEQSADSTRALLEAAERSLAEYS